MSKIGRVAALVKTWQKFGDVGTVRELGSGSVSHHIGTSTSAGIQRQYSARPSGSFPHSPFLACRPPYFNICGSRPFHGSSVATQMVLQDSESVESVNVVKGDTRQNFLPATTEGQKPRLVVLGTGWAGCRFIKDVNPALYNIICISPRNHMVFTPLLASTCVGTLEFRSVVETVRTIQPAIAKDPDCYFFLSRCTQIDSENKLVYCEAVGREETADTNASGEFSVAYDKLVLAMGAESLTFNIPGVREHAIFLREIKDSQAIRSKLLLNLAVSDIPGVTEDEKRRILHCVVVGGGPTGVEFSGELSDFIRRDVIQKFSHVKDYIHVTLIEATEILSSFDMGLRQYATSHLEESKVRLVKGLVKEVHPDKVILNDGSEVFYGLLVWSTGVGPSDFVKSMECQKSPGGRVGVDEYLRVPDMEDTFAIGDCSGYLESTGKSVLPALAQVAERQGKYLSQSLNALAKQGGGRAGSAAGKDLGKPFVYKHLGSMASVGRYKALVDLRENKESKGLSLAGFSSWIIWRSAYLTRVVSWRNRIYVVINWLTTFVFGRDISRF